MVQLYVQVFNHGTSKNFANLLKIRHLYKIGYQKWYPIFLYLVLKHFIYLVIKNIKKRYNTYLRVEI